MHPRAREFKKQAEAAYDITVEIREFPEGTKTAGDAAAAIGCDLAQIVKSIVMIANGEMIVLLASGKNRVSEEKLATEFDVSQDSVRSANADEVRETIGWSIGGVPPFCHETPVPVYLDETLTEYETVWAAAGTSEAVFGISPSTLRRNADATRVDVFDR